jgi:predicted signal transduction protein with EAL and GGDEF domain
MGSVLDQQEASISLALRMIDTVARPFDLDGQQAHIGASVGIAFAPADGAAAEELLKKADLALYAAKLDGRNTYRFYRPAMQDELQTQQAAETELREAIEKSQFELHYQPVIDIRTRELSGLEAVVCWRHPTKGLIAPEQFVPLAESTGLIVPLGNWIVRQTCTEAMSWPAHTDCGQHLRGAVQKRRLVRSYITGVDGNRHLAQPTGVGNYRNLTA